MSLRRDVRGAESQEKLRLEITFKVLPSEKLPHQEQEENLS